MCTGLPDDFPTSRSRSAEGDLNPSGRIMLLTTVTDLTFYRSSSRLG